MRDWMREFSREWGIHPVTLALVIAGLIYLCYQIIPELIMGAI